MGYLLRSPCREDGVVTPLQPDRGPRVPRIAREAASCPAAYGGPSLPTEARPGKPSPMWPRPSRGSEADSPLSEMALELADIQGNIGPPPVRGVRLMLS